jgi:hypothetical protein
MFIYLSYDLNKVLLSSWWVLHACKITELCTINVSFMNVVVRWFVLCLELMYAYVTCSISDGFVSQ